MSEPAQRAIDDAMAAERPAKQTIRGWWVEQSRTRVDLARQLDAPLYLTLPGQGRDVEALIEAGVVRVNESGGIIDEDSGLVVAVEANLVAANELRKKFPNITAKSVSMQNLLAGPGLTAYPDRRTKAQLRSLVANLDFNCPYKLEPDGSVVEMSLAFKLAQLHAHPDDVDVRDWVLCLTFNGSAIVGDPARIDDQVKFLREQGAGSSTLGPLLQNLCPWLHDGYSLSLETDSIRCQRILLALVPTRLASMLVPLGFSIQCVKAAAYGHDTAGAAPMVTFVFAVKSDPAFRATPETAKRATHESLSGALCEVLDDGTEVPLAPLRCPVSQAR